MAQAVMLKSCI